MPTVPTFFTICTRHYAAMAYTLAASVREVYPESRFTVWFTDPGEPPGAEDHVRQRVVAESLPDKELEALRFYYSTLELCTALKPRLFQQHFREGASRVVYLDPDILLFRPLDDALRPLDHGACGVLTPHLSAALPRDGLKPDDLVILQSGIYNLGFLALNACADADELLDWWWGWLKTHCFISKSEGTFTDQRWMDLATVFWPKLHVLQDTTCNVAYWNLPQRTLAAASSGFTVDGNPLTFFHFSGFDPGQPDRLSRHDTRSVVEPQTPLANLLLDYSRRLDQRGHADLRRLPPGHVRFHNGVAFDAVAHHVFRQTTRAGMRFEDPAEVGPWSFLAWMCKPLDDPGSSRNSVPLTRYLLGIHELRPDLQQRFPDVWKADRRDFLRWVERNAVREIGANPDLLALQPRLRHRLPGIRALTWFLRGNGIRL